MICYIFDDSHKQAKLNRTLVQFTVVISVYAILAEIRNYEQHKKIEHLGKEIRKFKRMKGE